LTTQEVAAVAAAIAAADRILFIDVFLKAARRYFCGVASDDGDDVDDGDSSDGDE
jgi:hypothetical protein